MYVYNGWKYRYDTEWIEWQSMSSTPSKNDLWTRNDYAISSLCFHSRGAESSDLLVASADRNSIKAGEKYRLQQCRIPVQSFRFWYCWCNETCSLLLMRSLFLVFFVRFGRQPLVEWLHQLSRQVQLGSTWHSQIFQTISTELTVLSADPFLISIAIIKAAWC